MEDLLKQIDKLDRDLYLVEANKSVSPTDEDIQEFEEKYGFHLPEDFKMFLKSKYGAFQIEVTEKAWKKAQVHQLVEQDYILRGFKIYGLGQDVSDEMSLIKRTDEMHEMSYEEFVPFMVYKGDFVDQVTNEVYCFDEEGNIVLFDYYQTFSEIDVDASFTELVKAQLEHLEEKIERYRNYEMK